MNNTRDYYKITAKDILDNLLNLSQISFEVTDGCNLNCQYCGLGELYDGHDIRESKMMSVNKGKMIIDYLADIWKSHNQNGKNQMIFISFYGGEPLLNMSFIKKIVSYTELLTNKVNKRFHYSMTTNAILIDKYMDYLVEKKFYILVSLDGDKKGQSYRVDHAGHNSFDKVFSNMKLLQKTYPDYFEKFISFNSVLHKRNSVADIYNFFKTEFNKLPKISEVRPFGVRSDKIEEFKSTYRNKKESIGQADNYEKLSEELFIENPDTKSLMSFIRIQSNNIYEDLNEILYDSEKKLSSCTGTCHPFSRKMFVTVNGKIMQCDRIDHKYYYGMVTDDKVVLDCQQVADLYNELLSKVSKTCMTCYRYKLKNCIQCAFFIYGLETEKPSCLGYMNKDTFQRYKKYNLNYLAGHPELYKKLMDI